MALIFQRGFLGFSHYGHPCFIREEYEKAHEGEGELQRLEDALGMTFPDLDTALYYALTHARYLLYRLESEDIDAELLQGRDPWMKFRDGYVHIVTGEYVPGGIYPTNDSYPCWKIGEPASRYFDPHSAVQLSGKLGLLATIFSALAHIMGGQQ